MWWLELFALYGVPGSAFNWLGNNFEFEVEVDAEKVLQGEPWAYGKHLVVFQHFDGKLALKDLEFRFCSFWI